MQRKEKGKEKEKKSEREREKERNGVYRSHCLYVNIECTTPSSSSSAEVLAPVVPGSREGTPFEGIYPDVGEREGKSVTDSPRGTRSLEEPSRVHGRDSRTHEREQRTRGGRRHARWPRAASVPSFRRAVRSVVVGGAREFGGRGIHASLRAYPSQRAIAERNGVVG